MQVKTPSATYQDEWDLLIAEFGLASEPIPMPMSKDSVKIKLLAARGVFTPVSAEREDI